jgi:CRISPR type III-B/RAMP module RAMP protein Cmr1
MIQNTYSIEFITPCFCAGADPAQAEIRAPSIRGQLRWWFRILRGTAADEAAIFGSAAGESGVGSSVRVEVRNLKLGPAWTPPDVDQNTAQSYTWHYARESGKAANSGRHTPGPRWQAKGAIPPRSQFDLVIKQIRPLDEARRRAFDAALQAFLCFGTIGLRATRGLGAFHCPQATPWREQADALAEAGFRIAIRQQPEAFSTWESALNDWSAWLRYKLRDPRNGGVKADHFSALGGIEPLRQASAIRFRPIRLPGGQFTWLGLEAPHARVLGRHAPETLTPILFTGRAPSPPPRTRAR